MQTEVFILDKMVSLEVSVISQDLHMNRVHLPTLHEIYSLMLYLQYNRNVFTQLISPCTRLGHI